MASTHKVQNVGYNASDYTATVKFTNGHTTLFKGFTQGGPVVSLRHFYLFQGDERVVQYDGRLHRSGPQPDEHRFAYFASGYDARRAAAYWQASWEYVDAMLRPRLFRKRPANDAAIDAVQLLISYSLGDLGKIQSDL